MGQEIVYCYKCQRRIVGAEFAKGQAYQVGDNFSCSGCAAELMPKLPPKEREQLLAQMFKSTRDRSPTPSPKPSASPSALRRSASTQVPAVGGLPSTAPRWPAAAVWLSVGGAAAVLVLVLVLTSGGRAPDPPAPVAPPKERAAVPPPSPEPSEEARRREAIAKALGELEEQARPKLAGEEFKAATDLYQTARPRYAAAEWTGPIDRKIHEIRERAEQTAALLREKAVAAQTRRAPAEARAFVDRVARWGFADVEAEFRRAVEAAVPPAPPPPAGPVARWALDEGSGAAATDATGKLRASFKGSVGWTAGRAGPAVKLDGTGAHVELPNSPVLDRLQMGSYTLSIWFKPDALPQDPKEASFGGAQALVMKAPLREGLVYIKGGHFLMIHFLQDGKWTSAGNWLQSFGPGTWYHVVGIVDQAAGEDRIYVNGQLMSSEKWPKDSPSPDLGGQRWTVGMVRWDKDTYFARGALSDLRFYDRALGAAEVASLHAAGPEKGSVQPR